MSEVIYMKYQEMENFIYDELVAHDVKQPGDLLLKILEVVDTFLKEEVSDKLNLVLKMVSEE